MNSIEDFRIFTDSTEYMVIGESIYENMYDDFSKFTGDKAVFIIADENTMLAAGNDFVSFCSRHKITIEGKLIFPSEPELTSDYKHIEEIKNLIISKQCIPIAIGSGTINDLVKRAAHETERPYGVIATAASVDGYASDGAAILYEGLKQTLPCAAPVFIAADNAVLQKAPQEMTAAGYADLLAKNPAGADWIIADSVDLDKIDKQVWPVLQGNLLNWISDPDNLSNIFKGLNVAGFTMQYLKRSRPVSGAEHLMSHIWEMEGHTYLGHHVSHGFKVALGSLASIALMETVFSFEFTDILIENALKGRPSIEKRLSAVESYFSGSNALNDLLTINREKSFSIDILEKRLIYLSENWQTLREKVNSHLIPYNKYKELLENAGCPVTPEDIGLTADRVTGTFYPAQMMRNRYTILDLAFETGLLDKAVEKIDQSTLYLK